MKPLAFLILGCLTAPALADIVHLTDGTNVDGEIKRTNDGYLVTDASGKMTTVPFAQVKSIEIRKAPLGTEGAEQRLASLRRAVANATDPKQVVQRLKDLIAQNPGTPAANEAEKDLRQWQERLDKGLVRAGEQWVTPEQLAEVQSKATEMAEQLRPLLKSGKLNEASAAIDKALAAAPQNPALLYLKGVVLYRQNQLVPSRKAFEAVEAQIADHGQTQNNLAVILWQTHAQMPALAHYDKAMMADANNQRILDNVAEALHALPPEHRKNDLTKKVINHFNDQEAALEQQMAQKGLYRWGSQWLEEKEFNKIKAENDQVQQKIDGYKKDALDIQARIARIDRDIAEETNVANAIAQESTQVDQSGHVVQFPLPQRYWDLRRDIESLKTERAFKLKSLQGIPKLVADLEKTKPAPKYSGSQKIFDADAMPGGSANSSDAAQPDTRPAQPATQPARPATESQPPAVTPSVHRSGGADFSPAH